MHESVSQNQSTSSSQFIWPNISALFLNKWITTEDSVAKRDQRDRVCTLKDELLDCNGDMAMVVGVLEEKGLPLFRRYYDGSGVVELLKQLDSSPVLALQVKTKTYFSLSVSVAFIVVVIIYLPLFDHN